MPPHLTITEDDQSPIQILETSNEPIHPTEGSAGCIISGTWVTNENELSVECQRKKIKSKRCKRRLRNYRRRFRRSTAKNLSSQSAQWTPPTERKTTNTYKINDNIQLVLWWCIVISIWGMYWDSTPLQIEQPITTTPTSNTMTLFLGAQQREIKSRQTNGMSLMTCAAHYFNGGAVQASRFYPAQHFFPKDLIENANCQMSIQLDEFCQFRFFEHNTTSTKFSHVHKQHHPHRCTEMSVVYNAAVRSLDFVHHLDNHPFNVTYFSYLFPLMASPHDGVSVNDIDLAVKFHH